MILNLTNTSFLAKTLLSATLMLLGLTWARGQSLLIKTVDETGASVGLAQVAAFKMPDSTLAAQGNTDLMEGKLTLQLKPGTYRIKAVLVGYAAATSPLLEIKAGGNHAVSLTLNSKADVKDAIEVVGRKPIFKQEAGKLTVDIENSTLNEGTDALQILRRMPGVSVEGERNITIRGKQGVMVMIDDKPTFYSPEQLAIYLRSLPSSQIKEIEIITQPDSRFDAQGTSGIINIKTRRTKRVGYSGEVHGSYGQGVFHKANVGGSLNYINGNWKTYGALNAVSRGWLMEIRNDRTYPFRTPSGDFTESQTSDVNYFIYNRGLSARLGGEYDNGTHSIRLEGNGGLNNEVFESYGQNGLFGANLSPVSRTISTDYNPDRVNNLELNLTTRHKLDTSGQDLSFTANYGQFLQRSTQEFRTWTTPAGSSTILPNETFMITTPSNRVAMAKVDYTLPLAHDWKLEAGAKLTQVWVFTQNDFFRVNSGVQSADSARTNGFDYKEQIRAAYGQVSKKWKNMSMMAGLRMEQWVVDGRQTNGNANFKRDLTYFFPSLGLEYKVDSHSTATLQFSRRINRPSYGNMNPYAFQIDAFSVYAGNPNILPEISYAAEITYSMLDGAVSVGTSIGFNDNTLVSDASYRFSDTSRTLFVAPINIPRYYYASLFAFGSLPITKWWNVDYWGGFFYDRFEGNILGGEFKNDVLRPQANLTNSFTLSDTWTAEVSGNGSWWGAYNVNLNAPFGQVSLGMRKSFWNKAASVTLTANDIFWTEAYRNRIDSRWLNNQSFFRGDSRVFTISFSYNFGREEFKGPSKADRDSELQRMGGR